MTETPTQFDLVTLAVYALDGHLHPVDMEDVAQKVDKLAPGVYRWRKYPDQIDLVRVRRSLYDALRRENPHLSGSEKKGWMLTPAGLTWVRQEGQRFLEGTSVPVQRQERHGSVREEERWKRERARILMTPAWQRWQQGLREIAEQDASEVFRIDAYAFGRTLDMKITRVRELFDEDPDLGPFIAASASVIEQKHKDKG
ncbi:MAG: hypothetical protein ACR2PL_14130 [Dehalococcoidia bacterium]